MKLVQCPKKHYYDADKYSECPICHPASKINLQKEVEPRSNDDETVSLYEEKVEEEKMPEPQSFAFEKEETVPVEEEKEEESEESLADIIKKASQTVSVDDDDDKTVPFYARKDDTGHYDRGYVVGWLVGVKGAPMGKSYEIFAGKNTIGRGPDSDIQITGDRSIARVKHAIVIFDPKSQEFIAMPGESRELYYVNGDLLLSPRKLSNNDRLSLGESELMLMELCGENFSWEEEEAK